MLKSLLSLTFLLFATIQLSSQEYQPLVVENNQWIFENKVWDIDPLGGWIFYHYGYTIQIKGDTLLNGTSYKQLQLLEVGSSTFVGGIREEVAEQRVYVYLADTDLLDLFVDGCNNIQEQEVLLYDFSVEVGDTISSCFPGGEVYQRDSLIHVGDTLNRVWVNGHVIIAEEYWIEGIGSIRGLFGPFTGEFENEWSLTCFRSDEMANFAGPNLDPQAAKNCLGLVAVKDASLPSIQYYPNPARDFLYIDDLPLGSNIEIVLYNQLGQAVAHYSELLSEARIDLSSLHPGLYHLAVLQNQQTISLDKLVILRE